MIRQRGVILLSALIMVALATIIAASMFFKTVMTARRAAGNFSMQQALQLAQGSEALAAYGLSEDTNQTTDTYAEDWALLYGPVEVEKGISLEAQLYDEQAKFNINSLVGQDGKPVEDAVKVFRRLLELCGLETRWADQVVDLIDPDNVPVPGGAEDNLYVTGMPPHLAGNVSFSSLSELMQLPGFTKAMYDVLAEHVTALPPGVRQINVCTADGFVLDALYAVDSKRSGYVEHSARSKEDLAQLRTNECFPRRTDLMGEDSKIGPLTAERTSYLRLKTFINIGSAEYTVYSLIYRQGNQARAVVRSFGTD